MCVKKYETRGLTVWNHLDSKLAPFQDEALYWREFAGSRIQIEPGKHIQKKKKVKVRKKLGRKAVKAELRKHEAVFLTIF